MLLEEWMQKKGMTPRELAKLAGIHYSRIYHAMGCRERISLACAEKIERATGGEVFRLEARYPELFLDKKIVQRDQK